VAKWAETKYATNGDLAVAYRTLGEGERDFVFVGNWFTNVETIPEAPWFTDMFERFSSFGRMIIYDQPGTGASDPVSLDTLPSLELWIDSTRVVLDEAGVLRANLIALDGAFGTAALFAATYPSRTESLVSMGGWARWAWAEDYPFGRTEDELQQQAELFATLWGTGAVQGLMNPELPWNDDIQARWGRHERLAASPGVVRRVIQLSMKTDVRHVLQSIRAPALIIQHRDDVIVGPEFGRYIADNIPDAKYIELPGKNFYVLEREAIDEISEFLTGERGPQPEEDRVLATVLFTDIVDSTKRAVELGDHAWRQLLDAHDTVVRSQLSRFRGREVKTVGDGFLATFDGPARAIRCAVAIREAVRALGLDVRSGVHTGECEIRGEDVGGIAVHIGARVSAQAEGGEVLVSSTVRDLVVGSGLSFEDKGAHELKGVPGTWNLYAVAA
jgi:class 3 adenylate cyclase/pimeloyl-ACP methyl ester carboxylesterase